MKHTQLLSIVRRLPKAAPVTDKWWPPRELHTANKDHWTGWLRDYNGPGFYGRSNWRRDARFIYNHLHCTAMLSWLAEHAGVHKMLLKEGNSCARLEASVTAQAAAFRKVVPWRHVELGLRKG